MEDKGIIASIVGAGGFIFALVISCISAWIAHIVWIITTLASDAGITFGQFALAMLGTFVPPIGVIHGILIWFGVVV